MCTPSKLGGVRGLPPALPLHLRRPADPAEGPAVGAQLARRERAHRPEELVRPAAAPAPAGRLARLLQGTWVREGYRDEEQERRGLPAGPGLAEPYVDGLDPGFEPLRRRAGGRRPRRRCWPSPAGSTGSTTSTGELVIVDYKTGPDRAGRRRRPGLAGAGAVRVRGRAGVPPPVPAGRAAPPADRHGRRARAHRRVARPAGPPGRGDRRRRHGGREASWPPGRDPDAAFPANPGPICGWCDFRRACPAGVERPGQRAVGRPGPLIPRLRRPLGAPRSP